MILSLYYVDSIVILEKGIVTVTDLYWLSRHSKYKHQIKKMIFQFKLKYSRENLSNGGTFHRIDTNKKRSVVCLHLPDHNQRRWRLNIVTCAKYSLIRRPRCTDWTKNTDRSKLWFLFATWLSCLIRQLSQWYAECKYKSRTPALHHAKMSPFLSP